MLATAGFTTSYQLGQSNSAYIELRESVKANTAAIVDLKTHLDSRFDLLESRIEVEQSDLKAILMATGTVTEDSAFYAAVIQNDIWVFPSDSMRAEFVNKGMKPEPVTSFLSGFRVLPAETIQ